MVEDHDIVRQGIKALLSSEPSFNVVGEASNGIDALKQLQNVHPDLILMDMNMPGMNGADCTREVKRNHSEVKVLILSMHDNESYLIDMLKAGADGYVLKNTTRDELLFAIKKIANDGIYIAPEFTINMLERLRLDQNTPQIQPLEIELSEREFDVLKLIAEGLTNAEMAGKLFTSVRTIETRRKKLLDKTGTTNTATLIRFAMNHGLIR